MRCRGQPASAHGKPALVDRQNRVLTTGPVCRRRVPGRSRKNAVPYEPAMTQHGNDGGRCRAFNENLQPLASV
jgi:hypothetical protein